LFSGFDASALISVRVRIPGIQTQFQGARRQRPNTEIEPVSSTSKNRVSKHIWQNSHIPISEIEFLVQNRRLRPVARLDADNNRIELFASKKRNRSRDNGAWPPLKNLFFNTAQTTFEKSSEK
jgi:hypothetical protein